jgi:hypothetical protein
MGRNVKDTKKSKSMTNEIEVNLISTEEEDFTAGTRV